MKIKKYLLNCFLLLIPIFLWNILLMDELPQGYQAEVFWKDIPEIITYSENILRIIVFALPAFMVLSLQSNTQKIGLVLYVLGLLVYFASWLIMIIEPTIDWSQSLVGFMAPAYTTLIWFIGIGLIGQKSFLKVPHLTWTYMTSSILFVIVHTTHTYLVYQNYS